jgi:predicted TPR repeat methyltransferase
MQINELEVKFPDQKTALDQDQEWFEVQADGETKRLRIHDYDQVYQIPGLYETVVAKHLKCTSPQVVSGLLKSQLDAWTAGRDEIHALDLGAGNGMSGEALKEELDCQSLVGVDIFPEAREAALRDRPGVYDDYHVADLCQEDHVERLSALDTDFNLLLTVAALGYGDIPVDAFVNAFNLLEPGSLVAFNIKDRFFSDSDRTGYHNAIQGMCENAFQIRETQRYCHRYSMGGEPLYYVAVVGEKHSDADPSSCLAELG